MMYKLGDYSRELQEKFSENNLKGKKAIEAVRLYGEPHDVDCESDFVYDERIGNHRVGDPYCKLIYYTDSSFLNSIGWFPGGGTRIFVDKNGNVSRFKHYLE